MSRFIDADRIDWRLIIPTNATIAEENMIYQARKLVASQPTADVVEVVHGEWKTIPEDIIACSRCGMSAPKIMGGCLMNRHLEQIKTNYCPNCGVDMRGGTNEQSD